MKVPETSPDVSMFKNNGAQLILLRHADGSDGAVVELEWSAAVNHHAGVPAAGAHGHPAAEGRSDAALRTVTVVTASGVHWPASEASLLAAGEHAVDDGLPDAVEQAPVVRTEHQRLVVLVRHWGSRQTPRSWVPKYVAVKQKQRRTSITLFHDVTIKRHIKTHLRLSWKERKERRSRDTWIRLDLNTTACEKVRTNA